MKTVLKKLIRDDQRFDRFARVASASLNGLVGRQFEAVRIG
ncbi:hypothetical protein [Bradyrhizobium sp. 62]|nr:hypothetical protein [Bradyrhizobium sp. 62]